MTTAVREAPHHNTLTCYTHYGCRLPECVERKNAWARERDRRRNEGTWKPFVEAGPIREHLRQLMDTGITIDAVARTVGVPRETLVDFTHHRRPGRGLRHHTCPELAARILAVTPDSISAGRVDATGSHRRIQALVTAGWPLLHIGRQLGMHGQRPEQILRSKRVYAATRQQVADGYERLILLRPERRGVPKVKARLSRERGKSNGWPPPKYWADRMDVIDDPHFQPLYGIGRGQLIAADARELFGYGVTVEQAAERLGITRQHLQQELVRHPEPEPAAAETALAA